MAAVQRFILIKPDVLLPPEWGCAGCHASMSETAPEGDAPADSVEIRHLDDCPEVSKMIKARA